MSTPMPQTPKDENPHDGAWAMPVSKLRVEDVPSGAINLNIEGRQVVGPLQGFGQMWQKTYSVRLTGAKVTPEHVIMEWKKNFPKFWPSGNRFYAPLIGIAAGEVAVLNLAGPGGFPLSTGVMVIYTDNESFTFMNPEGHMYAGWITFSAHDDEDCTVAQAQVLIRANDPMWEIVMRLFGFKKEDEFWHATLRSLAAHLGVTGQVQQKTTLVDPRVQWSQAKNIWHNAAIRSGLYVMAAPLRWVRKLFTSKGNPS